MMHEIVVNVVIDGKCRSLRSFVDDLSVETANINVYKETVEILFDVLLKDMDDIEKFLRKIND